MTLATDGEVRGTDFDVLGVVEGVNRMVEGFEEVLERVPVSLLSRDPRSKIALDLSQIGRDRVGGRGALRTLR